MFPAFPGHLSEFGRIRTTLGQPLNISLLKLLRSFLKIFILFILLIPLIPLPL